jgi:hypothetical protein
VESTVVISALPEVLQISAIQYQPQAVGVVQKLDHISEIMVPVVL